MFAVIHYRAERSAISPAGSVRRGSDSPPGCHSLPRRALRYLKEGALTFPFCDNASIASLPEGGGAAKPRRKETNAQIELTKDRLVD